MKAKANQWLIITNMDNFSKLCGHGKANPLSKLCSHQLTCCKKIREANLFSKLCGPHTLKEKGKSKPFEQTFWSLVYNTCCRKTREANPFSKLRGHRCTYVLQYNRKKGTANLFNKKFDQLANECNI